MVLTAELIVCVSWSEIASSSSSSSSSCCSSLLLFAQNDADLFTSTAVATSQSSLQKSNTRAIQEPKVNQATFTQAKQQLAAMLSKRSAH